MGMRAGSMGLAGLVLIHPYFWGSEPIGSEESADPRRKSIMDRLWRIVNLGSTGHDDPLINPVGPGAPSLAGLGCARVMVYVAGKDILKDRGRLYYESVLKSGFKGKVEMVETEGEEHCFHIFDYDCDNSVEFMKRLVSFIGEA
ncbi:putative carboxylesterase 2 [Acorus calamus]|uniref:Carboxylesterase 2 n=1 Tax=Acorus calamus TaxID=4465 RepID=A0AAV9FN16_ACOCL|nr:putative carboxylesterase 2 [Acorus calamus]